MEWYESEQGKDEFLQELNSRFKFHKDGTVEPRENDQSSYKHKLPDTIDADYKEAYQHFTHNFKKNHPELIEEWGTTSNVRFCNPADVKMLDSEGNVMLCSCGNPAGSGIMSKSVSLVWCSDCSPMHKYSSKLIYMPDDKFSA